MAKKKSQRKRVTNPANAKRAPQKPAAPYATVGRDLGSLVGFGDVGERVGGAIGRLFGKGDYKVHMNSLMESYGHPAAGPPPPITFRDGKRGVRVVEREYLGDIVSGALSGGSSVFTNNAYPINPADATSFPWLSRIARQFDQWEPHGIVFEFRSTSSEYNGTTQALGTVILSTDYDPTDPVYRNKSEAENSDFAMSVKSSDSAVHGIECDLRERPTQVLYTRATEAVVDRRFTDLGTFQLCTQGMSAASVVLGELWVAYDITLYKKQLSDPGASGAMSRALVTALASTASDMFDLASTCQVRANCDVTVYADGVSLPHNAAKGARFEIIFEVFGTVGPVGAPSWFYVGCTPEARADNDSGSRANTYSQYIDPATRYGWIMKTGVVVTVPFTQGGVYPSIRFTGGTWPTGVTNARIDIIEVDPDQLVEP